METKASLVQVEQNVNEVKCCFTCECSADDIQKYVGKDVRITIVGWKNRRSLNANAYFYSLASKIAQKTSQSLTEVHNILLSDYGVVESGYEVRLPEEVDWKKIENVHLHPTGRWTSEEGKMYYHALIVRGSHLYDTAEMAALINGTVEEAKALGIETLTPVELEEMERSWKTNEN